MLIQKACSAFKMVALTLPLLAASLVAAGPAHSLEGETFAITEVNFDTGTIEITNRGELPVDPNGLVVCSFPNYAPVSGAPTLGPGESARIDLGAIGIPANPDDGELGLYLTSSFDDSSAIVAYVEWGSTGHMRSPVAQAATVGGDSVWTGGFVDPAGQPALTATTDFPNDPALWQAGSGEALPVTGLPGAAVLLAAFALLLAGITLVVMSRRRNTA